MAEVNDGPGKKSSRNGNLAAELKFSHGFDDPEQLISAFMDCATVGLAIVDEQLRYRVVNHAVAEMNGVKPQRHLGRTIGEILGHASGPAERITRRVLECGRPAKNFELVAQLPSKSQVGHWISNFFPIRDRAGQAKEVAVVIVEVADTSFRNFPRRFYGELHHKLRANDNWTCSSGLVTPNDAWTGVKTRLVSSLFGSLEQELSDSIWSVAQHRHCAPAEFFCSEGQPATKLFLSTKGLVKVGSTTRSGKEVVLDWMQPGEVFGIRSLLPTPGEYLWTVRAVEDCDALCWDRSAIRRLAALSPKIFEHALELALGWTAQLQERFKALSDGYLEQTLAYLVLHLSHSWRLRGHVEMRISDEELAEMAGTNLFSVNKVLNRWRRLGYIGKRRMHVEVLDQDSLLRMSAGRE